MLNAVSENFDLWGSAHTTKSTSGRGSSSKLDLHGIKKLRELILELAVRGKLVPQNPEDEPASVLLEKIAAEKTRLLKEKEINKQKPLLAMRDEDKPYQLPGGWEWVRLEDIADIQSGITKGRKLEGRTLTTVPYLRVANVQRGHLDLREIKEIDIPEDEKDKYRVKDRDLLIIEGGDWDKVGRTAIWFGELPYVAHQNHVYKVRIFLEKQSELWLERYLNGPIARKYFAGSSKQTTNLASINKTQLRACPVAIPPAEEEGRIVFKVNELMALCDQLEQQQTNSIAAHQTLVEELLATLTNSTTADEVAENWARIAGHFDTLFTTDHSVDQLKQTVLQLAVMGRLVPQNPEDEPASVLLEKIAAEKAQLVKDKKIKKQKPLPVITDEEKPFNLPQGWVWVRLGTVLKKITDGTHHSPPNGESGDYLYISAKNIKPTGIQLSNATYVTQVVHDEIYSRCDPEFGDILYIKDGATTGIATINTLEKPFSMLSSVALLKCPDEVINSFLLLSLRSPYFYKEMRAGMTGVAITRVTLKKLNNAFIALPPKNEQLRVVSQVNELMTLCNTLKSQIHQTQTTQLQLASAMVEQAVA